MWVDIALRRLWRRYLTAVVINAPLIGFLLYSRLGVPDRYVSYALPMLGDFPKGVLFDVTVVIVVLAVGCLSYERKSAGMLYLLVLIPSIAFVILFRGTDHYYFSATRAPLNAFVLYSNVTMVDEGARIVREAPLCLLLMLAVVAHYAAYRWSSTYSGRVARVAERLAASGHRLVAPAFGVLLLLLAINLHAVRAQPSVRTAIMSLSGEYDFLSALPRFIREEALKSKKLAAKPARFVLPPRASPRQVRMQGRARPDVFIITIESFNAVYLLPPTQLHPALTQEIMPFFKSLRKDGYMFSNVYTSSAYTFNGIIAVLCSQYTISESVWGRDCLPGLLARNGYTPFSFISIQQLRPYRFDNFRAMGFDRAHVFDGVLMRQGKRNVFFDIVLDNEVFGFASHVADSATRATNRPPLFVHVSTDQMHAPGNFSETSCSLYRFPATLHAETMTRRMLTSANCTDQALAGLVAHLRQSGLYDDALVIITADHAFNISFWDHTESELARIPLFVKLPKSDLTRRTLDTAQLAAQIDIAPTIVDYLGLRTDRPMYGRSLLGVADAAERRVLGISNSRLLSRATQSGAILHVHGQADITDDAARSELDALFDTVLYFDQNPTLFETTARNADQSARWTALSSAVVHPKPRVR